MKPAVVRRRRAALAVLAATALIGGAVAGSGSSGGEDETTLTAAPGCPAAIAASPRLLAGQMLIVRMEAIATDGLRGLVRRGEIAGVILFPPQGSSPEALGEQVRRLSEAAAKAGQPAPLVAIDQEGGEVKRLAGLPPDRSPAQIGGGGTSLARAEGLDTGRALAALGIDVDLAPVLDVPAVDGSFIASRAFSEDPDSVAELGVAFGTALQEAGVGATAKHFPGLGLATENTDLGASAIAASREQLAPGLVPFEAAIGAGLDLVMVSNATYPAYDPARPASQSPRIIAGLLRRKLGYEGAVITDDLGAGALRAAGIDEGEAAVGAAQAGADLLLLALSNGEAARKALTGAIRDGTLDQATLEAACVRNLALRERLAAVAEPAAPAG